ncbi:uncharacterized protein WM277_020655 isoform 2-T2 [Molossus nigricans]
MPKGLLNRGWHPGTACWPAGPALCRRRCDQRAGEHRSTSLLLRWLLVLRPLGCGSSQSTPKEVGPPMAFGRGSRTAREVAPLLPGHLASLATDAWMPATLRSDGGAETGPLSEAGPLHGEPGFRVGPWAGTVPPCRGTAHPPSLSPRSSCPGSPCRSQDRESSTPGQSHRTPG